MTAFNKAWNVLKEIIDMHEYPKGSGNFMSLEEMIHARNADARRNLQTVRSPNYSKHSTNHQYYPIQNFSEDVSHTPSQEELEAEDEWMRNNLDSYYQNKNYVKNNIMVDSKTGNYDPNDPEGWHPMGDY